MATAPPEGTADPVEPTQAVTATPARWARAAALVVVAHPDDEVLGCGILLSRLRNIRVVHVTDGAPRNSADAKHAGFANRADYAQARREEAEAALALAGISRSSLSCLGVTDQDASLHLVDIVHALSPLIRQADLVFTHAYEGGHSDHDAVAYAVHAACGLTEPARPPELIEMPFYYGDDEGRWVRQTFLPRAGAAPEWVDELTAEQREVKARMIAAHASQGDVLRSFSSINERFRLAPHYDCSLRPHAGRLLYEQHGWNLTWSEWWARVTEANHVLGLA
jgi:N-acetylglucosamine malate deacetylase 2